MGESAVKKTLKRVCCDNGWSYGVFWRLDGNNSMLLTLEDAYYEEQMGTMLGNMLLQVHMLGEGIIGQVAFTGKHRWLFSDACNGEWNSIDSFGIQDIFQGDSEINHQFSSGIKTIAAISIESQGVVLFGSTHKILESVEFLDRTKSLFREIGNVESPFMQNETSDLSKLFASFISSGTNSYNTNLKSKHSDIFDDPLQDLCVGAQVLIPNEPSQNSFENEFTLADSITDLSNCYTVDNLSELFSPPNKATSSLSSCLAESDALLNIHVNHSANTLNCVQDHDLFDGLGLDCGFTIPEQCWDDLVLPVVSNSQSTISTSVSDCISGLGVGSISGPRKGLFSELGLEELLNGIGNGSSVTKSSFEDQVSSSKRRRVNGSFGDNNQDSSKNMNSMQHLCSFDKTNNLGQPKKLEEPVKGTRKRARPGESTRPRPKDRQQIQDRLTELRKLIPNGNKPPIDVLLDRTIKYMIFLQSVTKYADKLKQADEPKMIDNGNGVVLKDNSREGGNGGVTWAFEVGGQTLVCPIVVEDLNPPGQMLIEMLCEDQGFFLEIADVIRGFGLNILKGVMELRENKIWARFIVEANKHVTRTDIFWSLIQLLQQTGTTGIEPTNLCNNMQQPQVLLPMSLGETLQ